MESFVCLKFKRNYRDSEDTIFMKNLRRKDPTEFKYM